MGVTLGAESQSYLCIPPTAPSYHGGLGSDAAWAAQNGRYGDIYGRNWPEPTIWWYTIRVELSQEYSYPDVHAEFPVVITGLPASYAPVPQHPQSLMQIDWAADKAPEAELPAWNSTVQVPQLLAHPPPYEAVEKAVECVYTEEDNMSHSQLSYAPMYCVAKHDQKQDVLQNPVYQPQ
eukprot:Colp12_sorted_trinity150504_noHs@11772